MPIRPTRGPAGTPPAEPPRAGSPSGPLPSGRVQFDDRGNAVWEWSTSTGQFGRDVSSRRLRRLEHPALSIADDERGRGDAVKANPLGVVRGYDPYDSGRLEKNGERRKKDLRRLSDWIAQKRKAAENKDE